MEYRRDWPRFWGLLIVKREKLDHAGQASPKEQFFYELHPISQVCSFLSSLYKFMGIVMVARHVLNVKFLKVVHPELEIWLLQIVDKANVGQFLFL